MRIGNENIIVSPNKCSSCGAEEISIYSVADGRQPDDAETSNGFYRGNINFPHGTKAKTRKKRSYEYEEDGLY